MKIPTRQAITIFLLSLLCLTSIGQNATIDSLRIKLTTSHSEERIRVLIGLSYHFLRISTDSSLAYAEEALQYSTQTENRRGIARALLMIGSAYNEKGKNSLAINNHKRALEIFSEINDTAAMGIAHNNLGIDYHDLGKYESAVEQYNFALAIAENTGNNYGSFYATNNIGIIYEDWEKPELALEYYLNALEIARKLDDNSYLAISYQNIGVAYLQLKEYNQAMGYFNKALQINQHMGAKNGIFNALVNKADVYLNIGDTTQAIVQLSEALVISTESEDNGNQADASIRLGRVYTSLKSFDKAAPLLLKALDLAMKLEDISLIKEAQKALYEYYRETGNFRNALNHYLEYTQIKDSIFNRDSRREISEMQTLYELDKKEKEIEIQNLRIDRQQSRLYYILSGICVLILLAWLIFNRYKLKQKQVRAELERKNIDIEQRLFRTQMNPHFIFNSLNSINSYITDNKTENAQEYLAKFARLMRYILENSRKEYVPVKDEVSTLQLNVELEQLRFDQRFRFSIEVDESIDPEFTYIPPMLIQPFVENAILHGLSHKNSGGMLYIGLRKNAKLMQCTIEDNGIGRSKAQQLKEASKRAKHQSLGMQVTTERLEILDKKSAGKVGFSIIDLTDESGKALGTRVLLNIPYEEE